MKSNALLACLAPLVCLVSLAPLVGCGEGDANFNVRFASDYPKTAQSVSILGVFKDGRMNAEAWDEIGPRIPLTFGGAACPIAFDRDFLTKKEDLAGAIDDYARENGVTEGLLDKISPAATGDEVLILTVAGRPLAPRKDSSSSATSTPATQSPMMRGGRRAGGAPAMSPMRMPDKGSFEVTASIYSPSAHKSVGLIAMDYSGENGADALNKFVDKLHESLPGSVCRGWHWDVPLDEKTIRALKEAE